MGYTTQFDGLQNHPDDLVQRVADRTRKLAALYDVVAVASESLDLNTTLTKSLDRVLTVMGCDAGTIYLLHEASQQLELVAWKGIPAAAIADVRRLALGDGLTSLVVEQGEPLLVPEIGRGPRPLLSIPAQPSQAFVGVPMRARGRCWARFALWVSPAGNSTLRKWRYWLPLPIRLV